MAVYTVKVRARPRPTRSVIRRRLHGLGLAAAKNARKYLSQALGFDARTKAASDDVAATKLIFLGDSDVEDSVSDLIDILDEAIGSKVNKVTVR